MVHSGLVKASERCHLPMPVNAYKVKQLYSLYKLNGKRTWIRVSDAAYTDYMIAVRVFMSRIQLGRVEIRKCL